MRRTTQLLAVLALLAPSGLAAQRSADQARLVFSVGIGQTANTSQLWLVPNQPLSTVTGIDTIGISRSFRRTFNVNFGGTYFPRDNLGFNVDASLLGLGTSDGCTIGSANPDSLTIQACRSLNRQERSTTSVSLSLGVIYRIAPKSPIHPYLRANGGMVVSQESFIRTKAFVRSQIAPSQAAEVRIYSDPDPANIQPYLGFGGGVVAVIGRGYQLRFEARDNYVRVPVVTGPTIAQVGGEPPTKTVGRHILSVIIGFDVVLERKRGRRY